MSHDLVLNLLSSGSQRKGSAPGGPLESAAVLFDSAADLKFTAGTGVLRLALAMHKNKKAWQVASIRNTNCARSQSQPKIMAGRASCGNLLYFNFTFLGFGIEYKRDALLHFD